MHPVSANDEVRHRLMAVLEPQAAVIARVSDTVSEVDPIGVKTLGEQLQQRHAVDAVVRGSEGLRVDISLAHRLAADQRAVVTTSDA